MSLCRSAFLSVFPAAVLVAAAGEPGPTQKNEAGAIAQALTSVMEKTWKGSLTPAGFAREHERFSKQLAALPAGMLKRALEDKSLSRIDRHALDVDLERRENPAVHKAIRAALRNAFMAEVRKAAGGTTSTILDALADGEGIPIARSLALVAAGETASTEAPGNGH